MLYTPMHLAAPPMPDFDANSRVIYEQPLSERMRAFLRLEFLFERARFQLNATDTWASRTAMETIIDVLAVMSRSDLKKELLKELERQSTTLEGLTSNPNVDSVQLEKILGQVRHVLGTLHSGESTPGFDLRGIELLSAVRQRSSIPAGTCGFDLPAYHFWLQRPAEDRLEDLHEWLSRFDCLCAATGLCLQLVRESAQATREVATGGFFQRTLETSTPCQMIRVSLPYHAQCYPEISAGRHRFTVRFMLPGRGVGRPSQTDYDVEFDLLCCVL